jgi:hypothetical protein
MAPSRHPHRVGARRAPSELKPVREGWVLHAWGGTHPATARESTCTGPGCSPFTFTSWRSPHLPPTSACGSSRPPMRQSAASHSRLAVKRRTLSGGSGSCPTSVAGVSAIAGVGRGRLPSVSWSRPCAGAALCSLPGTCWSRRLRRWRRSGMAQASRPISRVAAE